MWPLPDTSRKWPAAAAAADESYKRFKKIHVRTYSRNEIKWSCGVGACAAATGVALLRSRLCRIKPMDRALDATIDARQTHTCTRIRFVDGRAPQQIRPETA